MGSRGRDTVCSRTLAADLGLSDSVQRPYIIETMYSYTLPM